MEGFLFVSIGSVGWFGRANNGFSQSSLEGGESRRWGISINRAIWSKNTAVYQDQI
jgi:hypothetical protein